MNARDEYRAHFQASAHCFKLYFLERACGWGAKTSGKNAPRYLAILQEAYPNLESALHGALSSLREGCSEDALWHLWRSAVIRLYEFYDYRGLWEQMHSLLSEGVQEAEKRQDDRAEADFLYLQARIEANQGQSERALEKSAKSLRLFETLGIDPGVASVLHFRGMLLRRQDPQAARQSYERSLGLSEGLHNEHGQASTLYEIGRLEEAKGNNATAERLYREALGRFQELDSPREQATLLFQLGGLLGDIEYLQDALCIYSDLMDQRGYAQTLHYLGRVWQKKGDPAQAQSLYNEALRVFGRLGASRAIQSVERDLDRLNNGSSQ